MGWEDGSVSGWFRFMRTFYVRIMANFSNGFKAYLVREVVDVT
jgi:hypothetical protein